MVLGYFLYKFLYLEFNVCLFRIYKGTIGHTPIMVNNGFKNNFAYLKIPSSFNPLNNPGDNKHN